ncbi:2'-5' RNA ligase family protein [Nocardioides sp.]|uniref:2'-5' RNA ligase family protein n=1 Tax=Nocardioides sp. TaxID=35761 RepID=UPI0027351D3A|nr:2'-5' RNA ligase family protein [Nocardioides sp.]MDP3890867.1 2'-5' RNA ligase family protein [Nocardioides sp.]
MTDQPGHSVLVVPVPELEAFVRQRWEHYDPAWVSTDTAFTHAHITVLAPFLPHTSRTDLDRLGEIAAGMLPIDFRLDEVHVFPDGVIHLRPEPCGPFEALTRLAWESFPACPPYGGRYDVVTPHLTLDLAAGPVTVASTRTLLGDAVPVRCRAERLELHWYAAGGCRVQHSW